MKGQKLSPLKDLTKAANTAKAATGDDAAIKKTTGDDLYAILTKKDASDNVAYEVDWDELKQYAKDMVANSIRSGFSTLDFGNEEEVRSFFKQYEDWMKPAYMEVQDGRAEAAVETIAYDIALYKRQYKDLTAHMLAASVPHVNLQI